MTEMKASELTGAALDWAVAKCEGVVFPRSVPKYTSDWAHGGLIIERERITLEAGSSEWAASNLKSLLPCFGDTPLVAAMRCYVSSRLGDEVEIPEELI